MRKSIATVSLAGDLADKLPAVAAARFDGIELFDNDLVASDLSPEDVAHRCADLGLTIDLFQPLRDVEGCPPDRFGAVLRRLGKKFAVMGRLGVDVALACSNVQPWAIDDVDLCAEQLSAIGDLAADHGVVVAFEALAWGRHIDRFGAAWDVVHRADHPHVGVAVDTFHILSRGDGPECLAGVPGHKLAALQIADAPRLDMNVLTWSRHYRCFPGQGNLDVAALVERVLLAGYRGPLSLEVFSDVVRTAHPRITALDAMRSLLHLEEELRARRAERADGAPVPPKVDLFDPPRVPAQADHGFVEFAVDGDDTTLTGLLRGLGFAHVGDHQTRPVQWWRNGAADVCVTTLPVGPADGAEPPRPFCSALAVVTDDVRDVATRASALLWPQVRYRRGPHVAALPGMDTPGGLHVFLSSRPGHSEDWRARYDPVPGGPEDFAHGDWLGVDHVGVSVPADGFPAEQSFYRTVFGVRPGDLSEFIQPTGIMRSQPLRPPHGDLRIVLAARDDGGSLGGPGRSLIDQVAFRCPDVVAVVRAARAAGVAFLPVPDNYYTDLDARFDLDPAFLATLHEHGLMYDRDEHGTLIHAYTQTVAGSFYVEILQRDGGYDGYGSPSTHVRLAAQARADDHRRP